VVFSSTVFPDRAPEGHVMLTVFVGGLRDPDFVQADPQTQTARVLDDLRVLLGAQGEPTFRAVQVWPKAIPQYVLGYGRFKDIADEVERRNPGFLLAGTYRDGISLGEAIASGERAAARASDLLGAETAAAGSHRPASTASATGQD
jgi:protoporphyrinogen/coproporphyrinogen III oxidase